jgi:hypothetical protein
MCRERNKETPQCVPLDGRLELEPGGSRAVKQIGSQGTPMTRPSGCVAAGREERPPLIFSVLSYPCSKEGTF